MRRPGKGQTQDLHDFEIALLAHRSTRCKAEYLMVYYP